jgi:hypothetical protein
LLKLKDLEWDVILPFELYKASVLMLPLLLMLLRYLTTGAVLQNAGEYNLTQFLSCLVTLDQLPV